LPVPEIQRRFSSFSNVPFMISTQLPLIISPVRFAFLFSPFTPVSSHSPIRPFTRFSSFCRFWLPFLLPLPVAAYGCRFAGLIPFMIRYRRLQRIGVVDWFWCLVSQFLTAHCSRLTVHCEAVAASGCRLAAQDSFIVQYCRKRNRRSKKGCRALVPTNHHSLFTNVFPLFFQ